MRSMLGFKCDVLTEKDNFSEIFSWRFNVNQIPTAAISATAILRLSFRSAQNKLCAGWMSLHCQIECWGWWRGGGGGMEWRPHVYLANNLIKSEPKFGGACRSRDTGQCFQNKAPTYSPRRRAPGKILHSKESGKRRSSIPFHSQFSGVGERSVWMARIPALSQCSPNVAGIGVAPTPGNRSTARDGQPKLNTVRFMGRVASLPPGPDPRRRSFRHTPVVRPLYSRLIYL